MTEILNKIFERAKQESFLIVFMLSIIAALTMFSNDMVQLVIRNGEATTKALEQNTIVTQQLIKTLDESRQANQVVLEKAFSESSDHQKEILRNQQEIKLGLERIYTKVK